MRMNEEERRLVEMVLSGRTDAFEPLVLPYRQPLLSLAYRLTQKGRSILDKYDELRVSLAGGSATERKARVELRQSASWPWT